MSSRINWDNKTKYNTFLQEAKNYKAWLVKADSLARAADKTNWLLEENSGLASTHNMLVGMAIECLLKAALIIRGIDVVEIKSGNLYFAKDFKSHKLNQLAEKLEQFGFSLSDDELLLLEKLAIYIEWGARYPVPLAHTGMEPLGTSDTEQKMAFTIYKKLWNYIGTHS